jgi:hypothetical protein
MGSAASRVCRSVETINCQVDPEVGAKFVSAFRPVENLAQKFPTRILNTTRSMAKELRDVAPGFGFGGWTTPTGTLASSGSGP